MAYSELSTSTLMIKRNKRNRQTLLNSNKTPFMYFLKNKQCTDTLKEAFEKQVQNFL